jgi:hypothetical protein
VRGEVRRNCGLCQRFTCGAKTKRRNSEKNDDMVWSVAGQEEGYAGMHVR